jgi:hypothetical protein
LQLLEADASFHVLNAVVDFVRVEGVANRIGFTLASADRLVAADFLETLLMDGRRQGVCEQGRVDLVFVDRLGAEARGLLGRRHEGVLGGTGVRGSHAEGTLLLRNIGVLQEQGLVRVCSHSLHWLVLVVELDGVVT